MCPSALHPPDGASLVSRSTFFSFQLEVKTTKQQKRKQQKRTKKEV
jgi:hypothetical protein